MNMRDNTIFITGGGSGIGRGLAEAFHKLGNRVIIAGRRQELLERTCAANPGMSCFALDVTDPANLRSVVQQATSSFPELNCVVANAAVQRAHDFCSDQGIDEEAAAQEIETNLLGVIRLCAAFLPHLRQQPQATLINVSSGLGFVPMTNVPVYCATKAAVHSFSVSLRHQLRNSSVRVIELVPPYVDTDLNRRPTGHSRPLESGGSAMPLDQFIAEAMNELSIATDEAAVGFAKKMVAASWSQACRDIFARVNP